MVRKLDRIEVNEIHFLTLRAATTGKCKSSMARKGKIMKNECVNVMASKFIITTYALLGFVGSEQARGEKQ